MPPVYSILEKKDILPYLLKRGLLEQYKKAKRYLLNGEVLKVRFKERKPKESAIWYFRVNRQFHALGAFDPDGTLIVFDIDKHQN